MKNYTITLILWLICQNSVFAQTDNINWNHIPWDISEQQVGEIFKEKLVRLDKTEKYSNSYCNYIIENYQKYNSDFSVHFLMDENTNTLDCVQLKSNSIKSDVKAKVNDGDNLYNSVLSLMKDEYGEPNKNDLSKYSKSSTWYFDSTIVSLSFMHIDDTDFFVFTINYQKAPQGFDFRETKWGFSKKQVMESEKLSLVVNKDDIIGYESSIANMKCLIGYIFTNDKLTRTKYVIQETHTNKSDFISDYNT